MKTLNEAKGKELVLKWLLFNMMCHWHCRYYLSCCQFSCVTLHYHCQPRLEEVERWQLRTGDPQTPADLTVTSPWKNSIFLNSPVYIPAKKHYFKCFSTIQLWHSRNTDNYSLLIENTGWVWGFSFSQSLIYHLLLCLVRDQEGQSHLYCPS